MDLTKQTRRTLLICVLLSAVTLAVYWPVTGHDFISCDDPAYVTLNPIVQQGLTWPGVGWAFAELHGATTYWHPLTWLSHMLDCQLFGLRPGWHHLTSLLLHTTNALLLFLLLQRLSGAAYRSACVAAVFALHPLQVESVAWAAERKTVLSAFFFMLTLLAYARYAKAEGRMKNAESGIQHATASNTQHATRNTPGTSIFYLLSLVSFALGLMSKPMLVTLPFVLMLLDYWPLRRLQLSTLRRLLLEKLPFLALSAASSIVTIQAHQALGALASSEQVPVSFRLASALLTYVTYLEKAFWPAGLAVFYPLRSNLPLDVMVLAGAVLICISAWAVWSARCGPYRATGWFWFLGMLVPVIGLVQAGAQQMADRFMYLPLVGVFLVVVWELAERLGRWRHGRVALIAAASVVLLACAGLTRAQLGYWQDTEKLFQHAIEVTQDNYMAHNNLAADYFLRGKFDEAITHYQVSLALQPQQPHQLEIRYYLGEALSKRGRYEEAGRQFAEVLAVHPDDVAALVQQGIARARQGKPDEAVQAFSEALRLQPNNAVARSSFGNVLAQQGRHEEAVRQFEAALQAEPGNAAAHNNLAISLRKLGRVSEAISHYREAIRLQPDFLAALNNLAWILAAHPTAQFRNGTEAVQLATQACELTKYQNPTTLATLAAAYAETGQFQEAVSFAERAQELGRGGQGALAGRLPAMVESFRASHPYRGE
jgi:tetratricopeptide (TPR) repeat protein